TWLAIRATQARNEAQQAYDAEAKERTEAERQAQIARKAQALAQSNEAKAKEQEEIAQRSTAESESVLRFFQDQVLAAPRPEGQAGGLGKDVTIRKAVNAAEPKIVTAFSDQPGVEASIRHTLGSSYNYLGEPALAIRQLQCALELRTAKLGLDHPHTLTSQNDL